MTIQKNRIQKTTYLICLFVTSATLGHCPDVQVDKRGPKTTILVN